MSTVTSILRECHRLRKHLKALQDEIDRGPRVLRARQTRLAAEEQAHKDHHEAITKLKHEPGRDMLIYGSDSIVRTLTNLGLIDEYQLLVHPVVLGGGKPLFQDIKERKKLKLVKTKTFPSGVIGLYYQPDNQ